MQHRSPHIAYIQDIEEYIAVIDDRLQEAVKRAIYSQDAHAADEISQMQEALAAFYKIVFDFLNKAQLPSNNPPPLKSSIRMTDSGYALRNRSHQQSTDNTYADYEDEENRTTFIPEKG